MGNVVDSILFQPQVGSRKITEKVIWLQTETGTHISGYYLQHPSSDSGSKNQTPLTILYSHANAEDLGNIYPWCSFLHKQLHVNIFAYDYTGYGLSMDEGKPSEEQCYRDIDTAYAYLRRTLTIPAERIVLYGRSVGTGPSCYLASRLSQTGERIGGLILHSPFMSVYSIVVKSGCTLPGDQFPNIEFFPLIQAMTLLIHGKQDKIVPYSHSQALYKAMDQKWLAKPMFFDGMGHTKVPKKLRTAFVTEILSFLNEIDCIARKKRRMKTMRRHSARKPICVENI